MTDALAIEPHALATETADGSGASIDIGARRSCVVLRLRVSALSGTSAKLDTIVESAPETDGPWTRHAAFPARTVVGTSDLIVADIFQFVRVRWTLAGTGPSAAFRVSGAAHVLYATPGEVGDLALPADALLDVPATKQAAACLAATDEASTYLAGRMTLPLLEWTSDLTMHVANMAAYRMMFRRGFQPEGVDALIVKGHDDALAYLKLIATNKLYPPGFVDSAPADVGTNDAFVIGTPSSQWDEINGPGTVGVFGDLTMRG